MRKSFLIGMLVCAGIMGNGLRAQAWEVGGWLGTTFYFGDLNTNFSLRRPGAALGVLVRKNFDTRVSLRAGINAGRMGFSDALSKNPFQQARNLSFATNYAEVAVGGDFNFLPYLHGDRRYFFTPYLTMGASVFAFEPEAEYNNRWYDLRPLGTEGQAVGNEYATVQPALTLGGGFKVDLSYAWSLNLEVNYRFLFTDYLDDVSGTYADVATIADTRGAVAAALADRSGELDPDALPIGQPGRQRGDGVRRDGFMTVGLALVYNFATVDCPAFKK
jgi:hypothetical protein